MTLLKDTFLQTYHSYSDDAVPGNELWEEICERYTEPHRFYHTLSHLENMLQQLLEVRAQVQHWNALCFALYYHDVVYDPSAADNEEQSAELAGLRLPKASVPPEVTASCKALILATKSHESNASGDIELFLDADLSVLGQSPEIYDAYASHVRKEYQIYPDQVFFPARKKVLLHFLAMEHIYQTAHFRNRFETNARINLKRELERVENFG